jgi:hypothetical protein
LNTTLSIVTSQVSHCRLGHRHHASTRFKMLKNFFSHLLDKYAALFVPGMTALYIFYDCKVKKNILSSKVRKRCLKGNLQLKNYDILNARPLMIQEILF